jgi:hypothetical protein
MRQHAGGAFILFSGNQRASLELQDVFEKARWDASTKLPHLAAFVIQSLMCDLQGADDA